MEPPSRAKDPDFSPPFGGRLEFITASVGFDRYHDVGAVETDDRLALLREGIEKVQKGDWDATPFFANARSPLAEQYRQLVWDGDGKMRRDMKEVTIWFALYRDRVSRHYGFSEAQRAQAKRTS